VVMSMIPPLLFIFIVQRNLVRGLTLGALKR
jgi:ABC-type glycerol-3-phosphate transport system permease component